MEKAVERKLKQVVRRRLGDGQAPELVLAELQSRLTSEAAENLLAAALQEAEVPRRTNVLLDHAVLSAALLWAAALLIQNVAVVTAVRGVSPTQDSLGDELTSLLFFAKVKIALLLIFAAAAVFTRAPLRFAALAIVVLYAFPFGLLIEGELTRPALETNWGVLMHTSAFISYLSAAALAWLGLRTREAA